MDIRYPVGGFSPLKGLGDDFTNLSEGIPGSGAATYPGPDPASSTHPYVAPSMIQGAGFLGTTIGGMPAWMLGIGAVVIFSLLAPPVRR